MIETVPPLISKALLMGGGLVFGVVIGWVIFVLKSGKLKEGLRKKEQELDLKEFEGQQKSHQISRLQTREEELIQKLNDQAERLGKLDANLQNAGAWKEQFDEIKKNFLNELNEAGRREQSQRVAEFALTQEKWFDPIKKKFEEVSVQNTELKSQFAGYFENLGKAYQEMRDQTTGLQKALTGSQAQGHFGEQQLKRLLEIYNLKEGVDFELQNGQLAEDGKRPDCILHMGEGRKLIIDSKVSWNAYYNYVNTDNDEVARQNFLSTHVKSLRKHITELADKHYDQMVKGSLDYVVMFIPWDSVLQLALQHDLQLYTFASQQKIVLVSPMLMFSIIALTNYFVTAQKQYAGIQDIIKDATTISAKVENMDLDITKAFKSIEGVKSNLESINTRIKGKGGIVPLVNRMQNRGILSQNGRSLPQDASLVIDDDPEDKGESVDSEETPS